MVQASWEVGGVRCAVGADCALECVDIDWIACRRALGHLAGAAAMRFGT